MIAIKERAKSIIANNYLTYKIDKEILIKMFIS